MFDTKLEESIKSSAKLQESIKSKFSDVKKSCEIVNIAPTVSNVLIHETKKATSESKIDQLNESKVARLSESKLRQLTVETKVKSGKESKVEEAINHKILDENEGDNLVDAVVGEEHNDLLMDLADIDELVSSPIIRRRGAHLSNFTGKPIIPQGGRRLRPSSSHSVHSLRCSSNNNQRPPSAHSLTRPHSRHSQSSRPSSRHSQSSRPSSRHSTSRPSSSRSRYSQNSRPSSSHTFRSLTSLGLFSDSDGFSSDEPEDPILGTITKRLKSGEIAPDLVELRICGQELGDDGAKCLAAALHDNGSIERLDLTYNSIGDEGAIALANVLEKGIREGRFPLFRLSLRHNRFIGDDGAIAISKVIVTSTAITDVDLGMNRIEDVGATAIAEAVATHNILTSLDICGNRIGDRGANAIANALETNTKLRCLRLDGNDISEQGLDAVKQHTVSLQWNNPISDGTGGAARLVAAFQRGDRIRAEPAISKETFEHLTRLRADAANAIPVSAAEIFRTQNLLNEAEEDSKTSAGQPRFLWEEGLLPHDVHYGWKGKPRSASGLGNPLFWKAPDVDDVENEPDEFGQ